MYNGNVLLYYVNCVNYHLDKYWLYNNQLKAYC